MRYRDLAVVTGDLASYGKEIAHRFDEAGIPYFLDDKKSILENPFIELIRAALDGVKRCFLTKCIFRYLKTGFVYEKPIPGGSTGSYRPDGKLCKSPGSKAGKTGI